MVIKMINWISNWAQGIIVAVIIGTIIEMVLPEGNCKKYVKVVIGIYILFSIISPDINTFCKLFILNIVWLFSEAIGLKNTSTVWFSFMP